jgi:hypothetical protein
MSCNSSSAPPPQPPRIPLTTGIKRDRCNENNKDNYSNVEMPACLTGDTPSFKKQTTTEETNSLSMIKYYILNINL